MSNKQTNEKLEPVVVPKPEVKAVAPVPNLSIEKSVTGAPKNFVIRCNKCCWSRISSGLTADLADLHEIKSNCPTCGKARKFQCAKCGRPAFMKRIKGNA